MNDNTSLGTAMDPALESAQATPKRSGTTLLIGIVAVVGVLLLVVFYYGVLNPPSQRVGSGAAPPVVFTTYDGERIDIADYRGTPIVINFWASWCNPCRDEQPILEAAWRRHKGEVLFIGLSYLDQEKNARAYMEEFDVTYPNGPDMGSRIYTAYHVQGVPETFFIDANGNVQGFHVGPISAEELERRIQELKKTAAQ
ncbi:MAG: TlpA family protein disulfide reductase [Caldilineae bacterium]|nr:MAG: TlpA family protein disulfide reductase [Caldilineae bacterium]